MLKRAFFEPKQPRQQETPPPSDSLMDAAVAFQDADGSEAAKRLQTHIEALQDSYIVDDHASVTEKMRKRTELETHLERISAEEARLADKLRTQTSHIQFAMGARAKVFEEQLVEDMERKRWDESLARMQQREESLEQAHGLALHALEKAEGMIHRLDTDPDIQATLLAKREKLEARKKITLTTKLEVANLIALETQRDFEIKVWEFTGAHHQGARDWIADKILALHEKIKHLKENLPRGYNEQLLPLDVRAFLRTMSHKGKYKMDE